MVVCRRQNPDAPGQRGLFRCKVLLLRYFRQVSKWMSSRYPFPVVKEFDEYQWNENLVSFVYNLSFYYVTASYVLSCLPCLRIFGYAIENHAKNLVVFFYPGLKPGTLNISPLRGFPIIIFLPFETEQVVPAHRSASANRCVKNFIMGMHVLFTLSISHFSRFGEGRHFKYFVKLL